MAQDKADPTKRVTNPRIAKLIELEVSGRIKPEHQQELDTYRAQGLAPKKNDGSTESERTAAFLSTRVAGELDTLNEIGNAGNPNLATEGAALFGKLGNYATPEARQRARNAQLNLLDAALTLGTGAAYTKEQLEGYRQSYFPEVGDSGQTIADKQNRLKVLLEAARVKAGNAAPQIDRALKAAGISQQTGGDAPSPGEGEVVRKADATFSTQADKDLTAQLQAAFDSGATREQLDEILASVGAAPFGAEMDSAIRFRDRGGKGVKLIAPQTGTNAPDVAGAAGSIASILPAADTTLGATLLGAGNAASLGTMDELVGMAGGDAKNFQAMKEAVRSNSPYADLAGNVAGGTAAVLSGDALVGGLAGRFGLGALNAAGRTGVLAPRLVGEDILYGAGYGAGENNDNRLLGAGIGGASGLAGGVAGRGLARGVSGLIAPTGGNLAGLYGAGVRPTLGQRFSESGIAGKMVNGLEEAFQSIPISGYAIAGARQRARDQFERGAFNSALGELQPFQSVNRNILSSLPEDIPLGTQPHAAMQQSFDEAYDTARSGMQFVPDAPYQADVQAFQNDISSGVLNDQQLKQVNKVIANSIDSRLSAQGGVLDGNAYKMASSEIMKASRSLASSEPLVASKLADYAAIFDNAARRNSSPEAAALLDAADRGYAKAVRIEEAAAMRGANQAPGRLTPNQFDRAVQKTSGGVRSREYLRGDALMGEYAEAGKALSDRLPNSGTPERLFAGQAAMGGLGVGGTAATGGGTIPALFGLGSAASIPYLPGIRTATTALLAPRNSATPVGRGLTTLGRALKERQSSAGVVGAPLLGAPLAVDYLGN